MSRDIAHVLFVPDEGDPLKLLEPGPCGARPPRADQELGGTDWFPGPMTPVDRRALVLMHKGVPVQMGLWILTATMALRDAPALSAIYSEDMVLAIARMAHGMGMGTPVYLDAEGKEIQP